MTAAAVGTCAWAEEVAGGEGDSTPAAPTMLNETFGANWTLQAPWSYWSGAETAIPADGELTAGDALSLNTGSKVLRGNFMSDGSAKDIDTGLYFNATVTFKDPSDTLPTLGEADKFALVVLDNVESIDAGYTATPATNLWVIAKYGESGQRAYQLNVEVDPTWLAADHKIVVKAYENVMASGNCAGFLVKVDNEENDTVCTVVQSCAIVDGVIDYGTFCAYSWWKDGDSGNLGYLGYPKAAILGAVQKRYTDATLILSNVPGSDKLTSVDFQGQGDIDDVSLATTGSGFGTDSLALTVVADGVTLVDTDETLYFAKVGDTVTIKFSLESGYELKSPAVGTSGLSLDGDVYTYVYTTTANNETVTISAFQPVVSVVVGGETLKFGSLAEALKSESVAAGSELKLTAGYTVTEAIAIDKNITINLNGQTLTAKLADSFEAMFELANNVQLTITDDTENGSVVVTGLDRKLVNCLGRAATLAVDAGTFDACVAVDDGLTYNITGGKFLKAANATITAATGYEAKEENGYWVVAPVSTSNYPESDKLVASETELTADQKEAVEATFNAIAGEATDKDAAVTNYINTVYGATVPADALIGAKSVDISVKFNLPLMKTETPTIEVAPATVTADSGNAAAFEFTIKDGDTALTLSQVAKVLEMVQYVADLANDWAAATTEDVATSVNDGKAKVELKAKTGVNKGFMRLKLR